MFKNSVKSVTLLLQQDQPFKSKQILFVIFSFFSSVLSDYDHHISHTCIQYTLFFYLLFANGPIVKVDVTNNI